MKRSKLFLVGLLMACQVTNIQAAVYGTMQKDLVVNVSEEETIIKSAGEGIAIVAEDDTHYLVSLKSGETAQVEKDSVSISGVITTTTADQTKIRKEANGDAEVIEYAEADTLVMALEREGSFYKVKVNDTVGYIYKSQIDETDLGDLPYKEIISKGEEVVNYAKQFLGGRYVYGGNNLNTGVDCSGFVQQVLSKFDIKVERSSRSQYKNNGYKVSVDDIQPGDLVFYSSGGPIDHVAMYAGDGQIIHASEPKTGIKMSNLYYGKTIVGVKRVI